MLNARTTIIKLMLDQVEVTRSVHHDHIEGLDQGFQDLTAASEVQLRTNGLWPQDYNPSAIQMSIKEIARVLYGLEVGAPAIESRWMGSTYADRCCQAFKESLRRNVKRILIGIPNEVDWEHRDYLESRQRDVGVRIRLNW